jgi:hypothetical protein
VKSVRYKKVWLRFIKMSALLLVNGLAANAAATVLTAGASFVAPPTAYSASNNSSNVYGNTGIAAMSYFVGGGAGSASATYGGNLLIDFPGRQTGPFDIRLSWTAGGFSASSIFVAGAVASIWAAGFSYNVLQETATIHTSTGGARSIAPGNSTSTSGGGAAGGSCLDFDALDLIAVSAGGSLCLTQTVSWTVGHIDGKLQARLGAYDILLPFTIGQSGSTSVHFTPPSGGYWSFSLAELLFSGGMNSAVEVDACANVDVPILDPFRFGCSAVSAYSTPFTSLAFAGSTPDARFQVQVPESGTLALLGLGALGLGFSRRKRAGQYVFLISDNPQRAE